MGLIVTCTQSTIFLNETTTTLTSTLSLHDALPILGDGTDRSRDQTHHDHPRDRAEIAAADRSARMEAAHLTKPGRDRKSTRLNSSHGYISYAVFCSKKKI